MSMTGLDSRNARSSGYVLTGRAVLIWLLAFFGVVFGVNAAMIKVALDTMPGTEVDSSYRASMAFNADVETARRQTELNWTVNGRTARTADGRALVRVEAHDKAGAPVAGLVFAAVLAHPADKRADHSIKLTELRPGIYAGEAADVPAGQWDLVLTAARGAERQFLSKSRVILK